MTYIRKVLLGLDQFVNTIFNGWPDETLSARVHRENRKGLEKFINILFFFQPDHCRKAFEGELKREDLAREYRQPLKE